MVKMSVTLFKKQSTKTYIKYILLRQLIKYSTPADIELFFILFF